MKTVLIDNSLCSLPIDERAKPGHIYRYIQALAEAGVKYVELDFRTVMKMHELPDGVKYIFRLGDPMFSEIAQAFDFNYVLVTVNDMKGNISTGHTPVIFELPALHSFSRKIIALAQENLSGPITMARYRGSYPLTEMPEVSDLVYRAKGMTVPVDFCPMNAKKTALDMALKLTTAGAESVTLSMGRTKNYASLEEYMFTLMSVYGSLPKEFDIAALCKAAAFHRIVFGGRGGDCIGFMMKLIDYDIMHLVNADTGGRVRVHVSLKDKMFLRQNYVTALQRFIEEEDIPDDIADEITDAIDHFDVPLFDPMLINDPKNKILN